MTIPNQILCVDVLDGLSRLREKSVHLIVTSSPFNVGIHYTCHDDKMPYKKYLSWLKGVWMECKRVLVPGGRICINIDATTNVEGEAKDRTEAVHPLHVDFTNQLRELGYLYRGEICWTKQNAPGSGTAWGSYCSCSNPYIRRNSEYIILASKDLLTLKGDPMMCDLSKEEFHQWTLSEWRMTPETTQKGHPAPYPIELVRRCIKLFSYVGNIVLDPFNGCGTTTTTAISLGRHYIGIDNSQQYCNIAKRNARNMEKIIEIAGGYKFIPAPITQAKHSKKKQKVKDRDIFADE